MSKDPAFCGFFAQATSADFQQPALKSRRKRGSGHSVFDQVATCFSPIAAGQTACAAWVGVGAVGTVIRGSALFDQPAGLLRLAGVGLVVAGIVGLKPAAS